MMNKRFGEGGSPGSARHVFWDLTPGKHHRTPRGSPIFTVCFKVGVVLPRRCRLRSKTWDGSSGVVPNNTHYVDDGETTTARGGLETGRWESSFLSKTNDLTRGGATFLAEVLVRVAGGGGLRGDCSI